MNLDKFLSAFFQDENEMIYFRAFKAKDAPDSANNSPRILNYSRRQLCEANSILELRKLNHLRGVYFVVNSGGQTDFNITRFNAVFAENDVLSLDEQNRMLDECPIPPSIRVETKKSIHGYWLLLRNCTKEQWTEMQKRLIAYFDGDASIKNPSRVMRVPFFQHLTYNEQASGKYAHKLVEIREFHPERRYSIEQLLQEFPEVNSQAKTSVSNNQTEINQADVILNGSRNKTLISLAGKLRRQGFYEVEINACLQETNRVRVNPPLSIAEVEGVAKSVTRYEPAEKINSGNGACDGEFPNLFLVKSVNQWLTEAKQRPIPKKLFGELWSEGELCILFADTNLGKSILAVQIGESNASGAQIENFKLTGKPQKVLYLDFELSDKQFELRYSVENGEYFGDHYEFSENFFRAEINSDGEIPERFESFEEYLNFSLELMITETEATIIIVDNITYLRDETERAKHALPLMKELKRLKKRYGLSILALAHTPKRDLTKRITRNDLQGSKMLINFCDSSFAIGESHLDKNMRYIKQIKVRNAEFIYDTDNVCICQIEKDFNFLKFQFFGFGRESDHLKSLSDEDKKNLIEKAKKLSGQGKSQRDIAKELGLSVGAVNKYLRS